MLMFSEVINQSIKSEAGSNYENRIFDVLISIGIDKNSIKKIHDEKDKSSEYDFFFILNNKKFGISAKRTLRERYKQFIKTSYSSDIDIMIEITLGLDLTEKKANIIKQHGIYMFIADEIHNNRVFLQNNTNVFPVSKFNINTLNNLQKIF